MTWLKNFDSFLTPADDYKSRSKRLSSSIKGLISDWPTEILKEKKFFFKKERKKRVELFATNEYSYTAFEIPLIE